MTIVRSRVNEVGFGSLLDFQCGKRNHKKSTHQWMDALKVSLIFGFERLVEGCLQHLSVSYCFAGLTKRMVNTATKHRIPQIVNANGKLPISPNLPPRIGPNIPPIA